MKPLTIVAMALALCGCAGLARPANDVLAAQVEATERAFAKSMADRDFGAFEALLSEEALFWSGPQPPLRGKAAIAAYWKKFFTGAQAPFSWEPATVAVLDSGDLALTSGPVHAPKGRLIGTFTSIWRREEGGWRIVFDKGCDACEPCRKR